MVLKKIVNIKFFLSLEKHQKRKTRVCQKSCTGLDLKTIFDMI